ncbi:cytochrome P450 [Collybia nuda]|uniref:Cytochrome P450 n=1 Tax=Collybia nuda TaxID=64659 RepID=A0A9P5YG89_9AGAR|nr:cytochrome P450 [Collybia nuda]
MWYWKKCAQYRAKSKGFPLPPGPPRNHLIGNLLDIPSSLPWNRFLEWKYQYGDIVSVEVLGNRIILLNSIATANDLLQKRSNNYSDRLVPRMGGKLMGLDQSFTMLPLGPAWKQQRKLTHTSLSAEAVRKYFTIQEDIAALYLDGLIMNPKDFISQLRLATGRIIMSITYGFPIQTSDNLYISEAESTMRLIGESMVPGAYLVDLIPWLSRLPSWLPFNTIHKTAASGRAQIETMTLRPFEHVKCDMEAGTAHPSFTLDCLKDLQSADTYAVVLSFILAMAKYPKVQEAIKKEIDQVVGGERLPTFQDRVNLPYVNATIKEALRWKAALPLGFARTVKNDDFFQGYYIPAGSIVLSNIWAIAHDEKSGILPEEFCPERFLKNHVHETAIDPYTYVFGFGPRVCPGKSLGDNNLFALVTGLMATMNIMSPIGADGKPVNIDPQYTSGFVSHSESFDVIITPRSAQATELIKERVSHTTSQ